MRKRGGTKKVWLTSLILFPHTDAFQIDLHTAQCPFSLGLAVARALECTKPSKARENQGETEMRVGGVERAKQKNPLNRIRRLPPFILRRWLCKRLLMFISALLG